MTAGQAWRPDVQHLQPAGEMPEILEAFGLPHIFSPVEAAQLLRSAGLTEITECALRTRAYRKQVPFHLNGRRIVFTLGDLREIAEGEACRPQPPGPPASDLPSPQPARARRSSPRRAQPAADVWRARGSSGSTARASRAGADRRTQRQQPQREEEP